MLKRLRFERNFFDAAASSKYPESTKLVNHRIKYKLVAVKSVPSAKYATKQ